jgi:GNAT superfamily N-acetyltransferase
VTAPKVTAAVINTDGIRLSCAADGLEVGHAYLYVLRNDLHAKPFGFMEDVFVEDAHRGKGFGEALVKRVIDEAKRHGCYKLVATSRYARDRVHALYAKLGFGDRGKEFRIDFP